MVREKQEKILSIGPGKNSLTRTPIAQEVTPRIVKYNDMN